MSEKIKTSMKNVFSLLEPKLQELVSQRFSEPTPIQKDVIPEILSGHNVLTISETGSGKTEACMLPIFDLWLKEKPKPVSILYITPLRSLNRDLQNRITWWANRLEMDVSVRHGDTSQYERKMQADNPPDMLIVTPETLQAMLIGKLMRGNIKNIRYIIIDEVHELVPNKRGLQLTVGLERLKNLIKSAGNPTPRILALSATVGTPEKIVGFFSMCSFERECKIVNAIKMKQTRIQVESPKAKYEDSLLKDKVLVGPETVARLKRILQLIHEKNSVLTFTNTREFAEILSSRIKTLDENLAIETHHSSLSKNVRISAEEAFKASELKALICTSSLELGIDIGAIDFVIQYMSPRQVSKLLQRVGRSGHSLSRLSDGIIISTDADDAFEATVIASLAKKGWVEPTITYPKGWDVLGHQIVGLSLEEYKISHEKAFEIIRSAEPFKDLTKEDFLETARLMQKLGFLWVDSKFAEKPELRRRQKAWVYYYSNLTTIPDVKNYQLFDVISNKPVGSLDAEFIALHGNPGTSFIVKGQAWRILDVTPKKIFAEPVKGIQGAIPAWEGELIPVPYEVAQGVAKLRKEISRKLSLSDSKVAESVTSSYPVTKETAEKMLAYVKRQAKWGFVPSDTEILVEHYADIEDSWLVIHAPWGSLVNDTIGRVLAALLTTRTGSVGLQSDPYRIILRLQKSSDWSEAIDTFRTLKPEVLEPILMAILPNTELFIWRFIHVAKRFGVIAKDAEYGKGYIKKVAEAYAGTPVYKEALNEVFHEKLDLEKAKSVLESLHSGKLKMRIELGLSPFAEAGLMRKYEIVASERPDKEIFEIFRKRLMETRVGLVCANCGKWATIYAVEDLPKRIQCPICEAGFVSVVPSKYVLEAQQLAKKHLAGKKLKEWDAKHWEMMSDSASLVIASGRNAVIALAGRGVGRKAAGRILAKMHKDDQLLQDILHAEQTYARNRRFWKD
ncbi:MAG: DEAD/DEAH box helicase [Candidatus Aenigmarchaeota archaeon]|nr:DEAD/DEAH box helicase [Candidatus Aenigmarchaeota archaeon]